MLVKYTVLLQGLALARAKQGRQTAWSLMPQNSRQVYFARAALSQPAPICHAPLHLQFLPGETALASTQDPADAKQLRNSLSCEDSGVSATKKATHRVT